MKRLKVKLTHHIIISLYNNYKVAIKNWSIIDIRRGDVCTLTRLCIQGETKLLIKVASFRIFHLCVIINLIRLLY